MTIYQYIADKTNNDIAEMIEIMVYRSNFNDVINHLKNTEVDILDQYSKQCDIKRFDMVRTIYEENLREDGYTELFRDYLDEYEMYNLREWMEERELW